MEKTYLYRVTYYHDTLHQEDLKIKAYVILVYLYEEYQVIKDLLHIHNPISYLLLLWLYQLFVKPRMNTILLDELDL